MIMEAVGEKVTAADPLVLSKKTGISIERLLGFLEVLHRVGLGKLRVHVVDEHGLKVRGFASVRQIPPTVEDRFGREIDIDPENVRIVFETNVAE